MPFFYFFILVRFYPKLERCSLRKEIWPHLFFVSKTDTHNSNSITSNRKKKK